MIEYLHQNMWLLWTLISVMALILEVSSGTFYILCFALGAACSIVASLLGLPFWIQVLVFALATTLSVFAVRPLVLRWLHPRDSERLSNADALIGREGLVIEPITGGHTGYVRVDGDEWKAVSRQRDLEKGTRVRIVGRESIIVTVERVEQ